MLHPDTSFMEISLEGFVQSSQTNIQVKKILNLLTPYQNVFIGIILLVLVMLLARQCLTEARLQKLYYLFPSISKHPHSADWTQAMVPG